MNRLFLQTLFCLFSALLCGVVAVQPAAAQGRFTHAEIDGNDYVKLADVWKFYGFTPRQGKPGCVAYGAGNRTVSIRPGKQDFYVNNYRYILSYPIRDNTGLYISATDMEKLVDPVLRPKYSAKSGTLRTVIIDPGHGGHDSGAVSRWAREKDCNLAVGLKLRALLQKAGYKVVMTRDSDFFLTLQQRVQIANAVPDSIFVSIHHNSGGSAADGIETFTLAPHGTTSPFARTRRTEDLSGNNQDSENIALATAVHSHAIKASGAFDRGIQRARFSVLCTIQRPAILFEGGFVSNPTEGAKIATPAYQDMLAKSIFEGITAYASTVCKQRPAATVPAKGRGNVRTSISGSQIKGVIKGGKR